MLESGLLQILEKVRQRKNLDFREYKESTLKRRIERRLRAKNKESYQQYIEVLDSDSDEYSKLIDNLTIKVTEFFRNPEAWQVLREEVLPEIIKERLEDGNRIENTKPTLRVWCAGCATGEEVYSIGILIDRFLNERKIDFDVEIRGTDIDKSSLIKARQAIYKSTAAQTIPEGVLSRYFHYDDAGYKVIPSLRNTIYFKSHDLVSDEPLKEMDLVLCRNVAIYFTRSLQNKIYIDFYNSLNDKGYLFLGKAETLIGPLKEEFKTINKRWKIYQKNNSGNNKRVQ